MNDNQHIPLDETIWRRDLTSKELQDLQLTLAKAAPTPEDAALDIRLGQVLRALPHTPVSSNFTSRVMLEIDRQERGSHTAQAKGGSWLASLWLKWIPRTAIACICCGLVVVGVRHRESDSQRRMANSIRDIASIAVAPSLNGKAGMEVWQDFEVIQKLGAVSADDELIQVVNQIR